MINDNPFYQQFESSEAQLIQDLVQWISAKEPVLEMSIGKYMKSGPALLFEEEGFVKYAFTKTKKGLTIHHMVMYAFPQVKQFIELNKGDMVIQKGCLNIKSLENTDLKTLHRFFQLSSEQDFVSVMRKYARS